MQELIFSFSKSPVLSSCLDSYTCTQPEPSHRVILNNAHFRTNAMCIGDDWHSCSLLPSDFRSGLVWSVWVLTRAHCLLIAVLTSHTYARAGNNNDVAKRYSVWACVSEWVAKLFSVRKFQDTACDWSLQESCKLLIAYSQLLLIQRILSYWTGTVLTKSVSVSINLSLYRF